MKTGREDSPAVTADPRVLLGSFAAKIGPRAARELEQLVLAELGTNRTPSLRGISRDLVYQLADVTVLAFRDIVSSDPDELWAAIGAKCALLELWRALSTRTEELGEYSSPGDSTEPSGVREVWLKALPERSAAGLRRFAMEARKQAIEDARQSGEVRCGPRSLAKAVAEDLIESGGLIEAVGDPRGTTIREAGERWIDHLARLEDMESLWESMLYTGSKLADRVMDPDLEVGTLFDSMDEDPVQ